MKGIVEKGVVSITLGILTGGVFLLSGLGKLSNVAIFQVLIADYGFVSLHVFAPLIVLSEITLGTALCLGIFRRQAAMLSFFMVLLFTLVYTYGYKTHGIVDCGCFGNVLSETKPFWVYLRNFALLLILGYLSVADNSIKEKPSAIPQWKRILAWTIILPSVFIAGMTSFLRVPKPFIHPFEGLPLSQTELSYHVTTSGNKKILATFMSSRCPHCVNSISNYMSYKEKGWVDTSCCYILTQSEIDQDSLIERLHINYPELQWKELSRDSIGFVDALPTTFLIENDTIKKVLIGEIPSPLLLFE